MYKPQFNSVVVEIDDKEGEWGSGNDESMLGKSFTKGKVVSAGDLLDTKDHPIAGMKADDITALFGKQITWNEGAEAGTTFEEDGKLYGFIYWWDIRGVKE
jgi:hypothetical protein